jgi:O-antigen chain-terminating methyltransferase
VIGQLPEDTRLSAVKKGALRALRLVTIDQNAFNAAAVDALKALERSQRDLRSEMQDKLSQFATTVASLEAENERLARLVESERQHRVADAGTIDQRFEDSHDSHRQLVELVEEVSHTLGSTGSQVASSAADIANLRSLVGEISRQVDRLQEGARLQDDRLTILLREARRRLPEVLDEQQLRTFSDQLDRRFDALYTEFEDRYRGSRADILERLSQYQDLLDFDEIAELGPVIDLGSGRGEWVEFLGTIDVPAYGIDVNEDIGAAAEAKGLDVRVGDGLEHLRSLDPNTAGMVSMFHVAEHLEFETLFDVLRAAHGALAPGGVLLIETPNPSNLTVGASSFYLDPTHVTPVHPQLAEFLATAAGFTQTSIEYLNTPTEAPFTLPDGLDQERELTRLWDHLNWALLGPLDYALIARKSADQPAA